MKATLTTIRSAAWSRDGFPIPKRGFTIVEIVIASALALVIFGVVYQLLFSTINRDKVTDDFNDRLFHCRKVLIRIQRELEEAHDIIIPSPAGTQPTASAPYVIYKDRIGLIKTIWLDAASHQIRLCSLDVRSSGAVVAGSLEPKPDGTLVEDKSKALVGERIDSLTFTYNKAYGRSLQFRIEQEGYGLVGGVILLNF